MAGHSHSAHFAVLLLVVVSVSSAWALPTHMTAAHHRFTAQRERHVTDADVETRVDADADTDADAHAAALQEVLFGVAGGGVTVKSSFRAAVKRKLNAMNARDAARINAEFSTTRGRRATAAEQAQAQAHVSAYSARTPAVCTALWTWLSALAVGVFPGQAGRPAVADATVITNWNGNSLAAYNNADDVLAADIIAYVRFAFAVSAATPVGTVCAPARLRVACDAYAAYTLPANNLNAFTMGVEWELKWLQVDPPDRRPGNDPVVFAETAGNTPLGQKWLKVESDNAHNDVLGAYSIPELITGPVAIGAAGAIASVSAIHPLMSTVINLQDTMLLLGPDPGWLRGDNPERAFQYVGVRTIGAELHRRNGGVGARAVALPPITAGNLQLSVFPNPRTIANLAGQGVAYTGARTEFAFRPTNMRAGTTTQTTGGQEHTQFTNYVQTNFLMPVATLATQQFASTDGHTNGLTERYWNMAPRRFYVSNALTACTVAARATLVADIAPATLALLTGAQRATLLGVFTLFNYHFLFRWYQATPMGHEDVAWGDSQPGNFKDVGGFQQLHGVGSHWKNWFDIMPKTSAHKALLLVDPVVAEVLRAWYAAKDFADETRWADTAAYLVGLRTAMAAAAPPPVVAPPSPNIIALWAAAATGTGADAVARKGWALSRLRVDLQMFDPHTLRNPPAFIPRDAGHAFSTSPTHSRPGAFLVNGALSIVMESRTSGTVLNRAVETDNDGAANTWLNRHLAVKTWDGLIGSFAL